MNGFQSALAGDPWAQELALDTWQERYILTQVGQQWLAFPASQVAEIMVVERSQILSLPFYNPGVLGVVHYRGSIIPLLNLQLSRTTKGDAAAHPRRMLETLTVVRLNQLASNLSGVGIVIDQMVSSISHDQLLAKSEKNSDVDAAIAVFQPEEIPPSIWQPNRASIS